MPKKSKKSKSKRLTLHQKYKILKKVREHTRKKAKDDKKRGGKAKGPKDPGIPNSWPFKEQLVKEMEFEREQVEAAKVARREAAKERRVRSLLLLRSGAIAPSMQAGAVSRELRRGVAAYEGHSSLAATCSVLIPTLALSVLHRTCTLTGRRLSAVRVEWTRGTTRWVKGTRSKRWELWQPKRRPGQRTSTQRLLTARDAQPRRVFLMAQVRR
jgi:hypothetical protein